MKIMLIFEVVETLVRREDMTQMKTYGIQLSDENGAVMKYSPSLFFNREKAERLVQLCNSEQVEAVHFEDVVDNALGEEYGI